MVLAVALVLGCVSEDVEVTTSTTPKLIAEWGDTVQVNYIGRLTNGSVFDTSYEDVAREAGIYSFFREYSPLKFTLGDDEIIPGLEDAVDGMSVGENKTVTLSPEDAYGEWDPSKVEEMDRTQTSDRVEEVSLELFVENVGEEPFPGMIYKAAPYNWNRTVLEINDDIVTIRHDPEPGTVISTSFGLANVSVDEQFIYVRVNPSEGEFVSTPVGWAEVVDVSEDVITLDFNHHLAGETLVFYIRLEGVTRGR